jgi:hypothetical protein
MAEIRVEPKRRSRAATFGIIIGVLVLLAIVGYFLLYGNG